MSDNLHPSVREFKSFLQRHPKLVEEARKSGKGFQEYYEKWALLGEEDSFWDRFKSDNTGPSKNSGKQEKAELMDRVMRMTENIDMDKLQQQVESINSTITTVQGLLEQFQSTSNASQQPNRRDNLFSAFKD